MSERKVLSTLLAIATSLCATSTTFADQIGDMVDAIVTRGDADGNGYLELADVEQMLRTLDGAPALVSVRDLDHDASGKFDAADVVSLRDQLGTDGTLEVRAEEVTERVILGDANDDGTVDLSDVISIIAHVFQDERVPAPVEAADIDGNDTLDIADISRLAQVIFGQAIP